MQRKESLAAQKLVSPEELDQARTQRNSDKARVDSNREEVEREMAAVQVSEDYLRKTRFDAPIDGTITQLSIERGEIAVIGTMNNPGTVILTVADLDRMKVEVDVDEALAVVPDVPGFRLRLTSEPPAPFSGMNRARTTPASVACTPDFSTDSHNAVPSTR